MEGKSCRLCGVTNPRNTNIFDAPDCELLEKIRLAFPIILYKNDPLPKCICQRCILKVSMIYFDIMDVMRLQSKWINALTCTQPNQVYKKVLNLVEIGNSSINATLQTLIDESPVSRAYQLYRSAELISSSDDATPHDTQTPKEIQKPYEIETSRELQMPRNETAIQSNVSSTDAPSTQDTNQPKAKAQIQKSTVECDADSSLNLDVAVTHRRRAKRKTAETPQSYTLSISDYDSDDTVLFHYSSKKRKPKVVHCKYCKMQFNTMHLLAVHQMTHLRVRVCRLKQQRCVQVSTHRSSATTQQEISITPHSSDSNITAGSQTESTPNLIVNGRSLLKSAATKSHHENVIKSIYKIPSATNAKLTRTATAGNASEAQRKKVVGNNSKIQSAPSGMMTTLDIVCNKTQSTSNVAVPITAAPRKQSEAQQKFVFKSNSQPQSATSNVQLMTHTSSVALPSSKSNANMNQRNNTSKIQQVLTTVTAKQPISKPTIRSNKTNETAINAANSSTKNPPQAHSNVWNSINAQIQQMSTAPASQENESLLKKKRIFFVNNSNVFAFNEISLHKIEPSIPSTVVAQKQSAEIVNTGCAKPNAMQSIRIKPMSQLLQETASNATSPNATKTNSQCWPLQPKTESSKEKVKLSISLSKDCKFLQQETHDFTNL